MRKATTTTGTGIWNYKYRIPCYPEAHIAVKGNRVKSYNHKDETRIYLEDGTEFQLEFYNDSNFYVKVDITINGEKQTSSLVLKPNQRVYLDRFMDKKKKFKFNTFMTGNDDIKKLKKIIEKNGRIKIEFYKEADRFGWGEYFQSINHDSMADNYFNDDITLSMGELNCKGESTSNDDCNYSAILRTKNVPIEIETGRVETGKKSKQNFIQTTLDFDIVTCRTFEYHIVPKSQKPIKTKKKDIIIADDIRTYCSCCGRRIKKGWNFCPGCGNDNL